MNERVKWTAPRIKALKGKGKVVSLTAYDYSTARIVDEAGFHLVLVGDSLGMTMLGYENTLPVTMEEMLHHTAAVARGTKYALVVADMPFLSYQVSVAQALENAGRFLKIGADAVKVEGGAFRAPTVRALVENGIPVLGHVGLTPQSLQALGGFKVQGKKPREADQIVEDAKAIEAAGAFAIVLEAVPAALAPEVTAAVGVPTIGIGAGPGCDGQILVVHDILGTYGDFRPKFAKRYAELGAEMRKSFEQYKKEVEDGTFPGPEHCY
ncbi:MAG: 3-methyl-2-oxobutanoate hydroxymethyltransferase [Verrucomicrobiota bacterium]